MITKYLFTIILHSKTGPANQGEQFSACILIPNFFVGTFKIDFEIEIFGFLDFWIFGFSGRSFGNDVFGNDVFAPVSILGNDVIFLFLTNLHNNTNNDTNMLLITPV